MIENVEYDVNTGMGIITISAKDVTITRKFQVKSSRNYDQPYDIEVALITARNKIFLALQAEKLASGFRNHIDAVATWLRPCPDMLESHKLTEKQAWEKIYTSYVPLQQAKTGDKAGLKILMDKIEEELDAACYADTQDCEA